MMLFFVDIILIANFIRILRNVFYHLFWWEKKEYRVDRMLVHLTETYQGRYWMFNPLSTVKWLLLILSIYSYYLFSTTQGVGISNTEAIIGLSSFLTIPVYLFEALKNLYELKIGWKIPPRRIRVLLLGVLAISLQVQSFFIINKQFHLHIALLATDKLLAPTITVLVIVSNFFFNMYKQWKISKAKKKLSLTKHIKVIGVTGSYGKTTTKDLIYQILSAKYKVLKTKGSQNTDIGIAELILSEDLTKYDYFVCEVAAYKKGEIKKICDMLKGKIEIGVITGINEQHQSLFGSIENTKEAKFELIEAVNKNGVSLFNGNSKHVDEMIAWAEKRPLKVINVKQDMVGYLPENIKGEHFKQNVSLAIKVGQILKMNEKELKSSLNLISLPSKTMNIIKKGDITIIDNTFNSNPDGVYAALEYLRKQKAPKILVIQPLIELGAFAEEVHEKIGKMSAQVCDDIVVTNRNYFTYIEKGVREVAKDSKKLSVAKLPSITKGTVLLQGKETEKYLKLL